MVFITVLMEKTKHPLLAAFLPGVPVQAGPRVDGAPPGAEGEWGKRETIRRD